uniref:Ribonucleotide reductase n=1 Tax=uncultured marine virus TaxID=186617 RepID=A0A0F7L8D3_9VIRU|nr:ribonucleotide reductase [uncultured marine virus]
MSPQRDRRCHQQQLYSLPIQPQRLPQLHHSDSSVHQRCLSHGPHLGRWEVLSRG